MPCLNGPPLVIPELPDGITLAFPLPSFSGSVELCCKIASFPPITPPFQVPPGTLEVLAPLNEILDQVRDYLDGLQFSCPKE